MHFDRALAAVSEFVVPEQLDQLKKHIPAEWIEEALNWSGTASIRRRRLPADQVVWLVIAMGLFRNEPIEHIVDMLGLALPDKRASLVAKSAITQARKRLSEDPLAYLFITHNLDVVGYMADEVAVMERGKIVERGTVDAIFDHPQEAYTKRLLSAIPSIEGALK